MKNKTTLSKNKKTPPRGKPIPRRFPNPFKNIFEHSLGAVGISQGARIVLVNPALARLYGYKNVKDLVGRPFLDLIAPAEHKVILENMDRRRRGEKVPSLYEIRGKRKDGSLFDMEVHVSAYREGPDMFWISTIRDITERKAVQESLRKEKEDHQIIFNSVTAMIWYKDAENRILRLNRAAAATVGMAPEDVEGKSTYELYPEKDARKYHEDDLSVIRSGRPRLGIEEEIQLSSGERRWVQTDKIPYHDEQGRLIGVTVVAQDVTAKKLAEKTLAQLAAVVESSNDAIASMGIDGKINSWNQAAERIFGYGAEEMLGRPITEIMAHVEKTEWPRMVEKLASGRKFDPYEVQRLRKDGASLHVSVSFSAVRDASGKTTGFSVIARDVTEKKISDQILREKDTKLRLLVEQLPAVLWSTNRELRFTSSLGLGLESLRLKPNELVGTSLYDFFGSRDAAFKPIAAHLQALEGAASHFDILWNGRTFQTYIEPLRGSDGAISGCIGLALDVTERIRADAKTQESERRLRTLLNDIRLIVVGIDIHGTVDYANPYFLELCSRPLEDVLGENWFETFVPLNEKETSKKDIKEFIEKQSHPYSQSRILTRTGEERYIAWNHTLLKNSDGNPVGILSVGEDITEAHQAELSLKESEERFRFISESIPIPMLIARLSDGKILFANDSFCAVSGVPRNAVLERNEGDFYFDPADQALLHREVLEKGRANNFEVRGKTAGGALIWVSGSILRISFNNEDCLFGAFFDITEAKNSERLKQERTEEIIRHQNVLLHLAKIDSSDSRRMIREITESLAETLKTDRSGVFLFNADTSEMTAEDCFRRESKTHEKDIVPKIRECPEFFKALEQYRVLASENALSDSRTLELAAAFLNPMKICSLMSVAIRLHGKMAGVLCLGHGGGPRRWSEEEKNFAATIADMVALSLEASDRKKAEEESRLLQMIAVAMSEANDMQSALQVGLQKVCDTTGWVLGQVWMPSQNGYRLECHPAWYSGSPGLEAFRKKSEQTAFAMGEGLPGQVWAERHPVWVKDVRSSANFPRAPEARKSGLKSGMAFPIFARQEIIAIIEFFVQEIREEDDRLVRLVSTVASQLGSLMEKKRAEDMIIQKSNELARSNTELEQFAYVASHDLKEPLRVVASYVQLLEQRYKDKLDADADRFIGHAVNAVSRMHALINDLLTYSRAGTQERVKEPVDCEQVFNRTLESLRLAIDENGAKISRDPLPEILGLESEIQQVFQNLISNAILFKSDRPPEIHVGAQRQGDFWLFSVRDNGIGIDPQYSNQIFKIFHRLHNRKDYPGNGIGLAISKKIVENYGGQIWVESQPGEGSVFYFTLPNNGGTQR